MQKAKELVKDKFWIIERDGNKIATLSATEDKFILSSTNGVDFFNTKKQLEKKIGKTVFEVRAETYDETHEVNGYPTNGQPYNSVFDVKRKLPLFTKSEKSKSLYCAGYYIIRFEKGWVKSFCPKLITVERYETRGPFKTKIAMSQELSFANKT